ncbi:ankyrin repeat domain-containing protein [Thiotrichales bacterium 19X7-9]|nr:ankyrin repeat domain-containing protein [Thiotrichales bacterium 19X7-9]
MTLPLEMLVSEYCEANHPNYINKREKSINPAYENIDGDYYCPLTENEHRIFVLTESMMLNTGIKLKYTTEDLKQRVDAKSHKFIDWGDPYGHPSIANNEAVYSAGYLYQRNGYLEVILISGRYNQELTNNQKRILEFYLTNKFIKAYGNQDIIFYDYDKQHSSFFSKTLKGNHNYWHTHKNDYITKRYYRLNNKYYKASSFVNIQADNGAIPIHIAAIEGNDAILEELIKHGTDVNYQDELGDTALHHAVRVNEPEIVRQLLAARANVNLQNKDGKTALQQAILEGNLEVFGTLSPTNNIDIEIKNEEGKDLYNSQSVALYELKKENQLLQKRNQELRLELEALKQKNIPSQSLELSPKNKQPTTPVQLFTEGPAGANKQKYEFREQRQQAVI